MESITATERELSGLMEKGFFVRVEPVKKGEYLGVHPIEGTPCILVENDEEMVTIIISRFGEMFSVKNEKGEKQCKNCGQSKEQHLFITKIDGTYKKLLLCKKVNEDLTPSFFEPLLVRLDKIESKIVWKKKKDGPKTCWLKTFRRIEK